MESIQTLSHQGLVWRANAINDVSTDQDEGSISTGFASLDKALLRTGWPTDCLIEVLQDAPGTGELSLFLPWLTEQVKHTSKPIAFIAPPFTPSIAALMAHNIPPNAVWLLSPKRDKDRLWAQQQCLLEGHCCAVFMWHDHHVQDTDLRKLQLAAKQGDTLGISIRPSVVASQSSPAPYRLTIARAPQDRLQVTVLKKRGGWRSAPILLSSSMTQQQTCG